MEFGIGCCCSCAIKWTPRDAIPRQMRLRGATVKIKSNPYMDMAGADIAIPLDGLPSGPLVLAGGGTSLGPGSGSGIGYFAINSQAVRLTYYSQWNPSISGLRVLDEVVGVDLPLSLTGYSPQTEAGPDLPPDEFSFNLDARPPSCVWISNRKKQYPRSQLIGTNNGTVDLNFSYDDRLYGYGAFWLDTMKTEDWSYNGATVRVNIFYNSALGPFPTSILGVPKAVMHPSNGYQRHYGMTIAQASTGSPHVDPGGSLSGIAYGVYMPDALQRVAGDANKVIQGRTVNTNFFVETQAKFTNGSWEVVPKYSYSVNASTVHYYTMTPISRSVTVGNESCYPITGIARTGTPSGGNVVVDASWWNPYNVTDATTGCFALFQSASTSPGSPVDGDVNSVTPFLELIATGYDRGKYILPGYLGTESYVYRMTPSTVTNLSVANRLIETHTGENAGAGFTAAMTSEEFDSYKLTDDPVDVPLVPQSPKTSDVFTEQYKWSVVGGYAYSSGGDPRGRALLHSAASGAAATIRRELI